MNKLILAKFIVFLLAGLLAAGCGLLFHKIAKKNWKSNLNQDQSLSITQKESFILLPEDETIGRFFACQNLICLIALKNEKINKIYVIHPQTGKKVHTLIFSTTKTEEK